MCVVGERVCVCERERVVCVCVCESERVCVLSERERCGWCV